MHKDSKRTAEHSPAKRDRDSVNDTSQVLQDILKAREAAGLTQAQVAARVGTTQSVVARLESGDQKHVPSLTTLKRYASALGYKLKIRFVKERTGEAATKRPGRIRRPGAHPANGGSR
jgi:transcriptional regulator with XRE-family HTH domain